MASQGPPAGSLVHRRGAKVLEFVTTTGTLRRLLAVVELAALAAVTTAWRTHGLAATAYVAGARKRFVFVCPHCFTPARVAWAIRAGNALPVAPEAAFWAPRDLMLKPSPSSADDVPYCPRDLHLSDDGDSSVFAPLRPRLPPAGRPDGTQL